MSGNSNCAFTTTPAKLSKHPSLTGLLLQRPSSMDVTGQKRKRVMSARTSKHGKMTDAVPITLSLTVSQSEPLFVLHGEKNSNSNTSHSSSSLHPGKLERNVPSVYCTLPKSRPSSFLMEQPKVLPLSPAKYWKQVLAEWNITIQPSRDQSYFLQATPERIQAYDRELLGAIRKQDLAQLQLMFEQGKLQHNACNAFGESLLHLACRKGMTDVVQFLLGTAKLSCWVHDDYGRTIAHDMCWTVQPNWNLVQLVLDHAPLLLTLSDVRGHIALDYVPKSDWDAWLDFLAERKDSLKEVLLSATNKQQQDKQPLSTQKGGGDNTAATTTTAVVAEAPTTTITATSLVAEAPTEFPTSAAARATIAAHESMFRLTNKDADMNCSMHSSNSVTLYTLPEDFDKDETRTTSKSQHNNQLKHKVRYRWQWHYCAKTQDE
jgi:hypothetical protein